MADLKKIIFQFFAVFAAVLLCACQATPEKEAVVGKSGGNAGEGAETEPAVSSGDPKTEEPLYRLLGAPVRWTADDGASLNANMTLHIDAEVILPDVPELPVASASLRHFTQEDADRVANAFFGENAAYREYAVKTKENIEERIISIKKELAETEDTEGGHHGQLNATLEELEAEYAAAPGESDLPAAEPVFRKGFEMPGGEGGECEGFAVSTTRNGKRYLFEAANDWLGYLTYMTFHDGDRPFMATWGEPYGVAVSKEEAGRQAAALVSQITRDYELCYVGCAVRETGDADSNWGWSCIFMRSLDGVPTAYASDEVGEKIDDTEAAPVRYEKITVVVNDDGIASFKWDSPMKIDAVETAAKLLPFSEIERLALAAVNNDYAGESGRYDRFTVDVTKAELGLMRVKQPNSGGYSYTPMWNIFAGMTSAALPGGEPEVFEKEEGHDEAGNPVALFDSAPEAYGPITLNAIDGSRIDRGKGY